MNRASSHYYLHARARRRKTSLKIGNLVSLSSIIYYLHASANRRKASPEISNSLSLSSKSIQFPHALVVSGLFITLILGLESYLQHYYPEKCLLSFFHKYNLLNGYKIIYQPNRGIWHDIGWAGAFLMVFMHIYTLRKKVSFMHEWGMLKHWLNFHIFCGVMGLILITFHTTFKLGGIISVSYWSMIIVALNGLFGRYLFGFIPRGISGNELSMEEIGQRSDYITYRIKTLYVNAQHLERILEANITVPTWEDEKILESIRNMLRDKYRSYFKLRKLNRTLGQEIKLSNKDRLELISMLKQKSGLNRRIHFLKSSHRILKYWHKSHIVFTVAIYIIAIVHVIVYYLFRVNG